MNIFARKGWEKLKKGWSVEILITSTPIGNVCYKPFKWNKIMIKKKIEGSIFF